MTGSNTARKSEGPGRGPGKPFVKGDARINRKGRPKSFDALRDLAQSIAHETVLAGGLPLEIDGHLATLAEVILRRWAKSDNAQLQRAFMEIAFGKPPENVNIGGGSTPLEVVFRYVGDPDCQDTKEPGSNQEEQN